MNTVEQTACRTADAEGQRILAALLRAPAIPLAELAREELGEAPDSEVQVALHAGWRLVDALRERKGKITAPDAPLLDRLRASWFLLRRAESAIKRAAKVRALLPDEELSKLFQGLIRRTGPAPANPLLQAVCEVLDLGTRGECLAAYRDFLGGKNDAFLARPDHVDRVLWWIVRDVRVQYIHERPIRADKEFLLLHVREQFLMRTGQSPEKVRDLDARIERQVDRWLSYSCLTGPTMPRDESACKQIVQSFYTCNEMKQELPDRSTDRLAELEQKCAALREENERLLLAQAGPKVPVPANEEMARLRLEVAQFHEQLQEWPELHEEVDRLRRERTNSSELQGEVERLREQLAKREEVEQPPTWVPPELRELRALLNLVDEKYPLDTLQAIPLGADAGITLKQFVSHLLYALRKRGLAQYPDSTQFDLTYDESGFYDCVGFEVDPGTQVRVVVQTKGWAFRNGRALVPVRKARVRPA